MKDGISGMGLAASLVPAVVAATGNGAAVDLQDFNMATMVVNTGAIVSAGDYSVKIQESDTTTSADFTDVDAKYLLGSLPATLEADSVYKQGYVGNKRYVRAVITKAGGTSIAAGAVFVLGAPNDGPVA